MERLQKGQRVKRLECVRFYISYDRDVTEALGRRGGTVSSSLCEPETLALNEIEMVATEEVSSEHSLTECKPLYSGSCAFNYRIIFLVMG